MKSSAGRILWRLLAGVLLIVPTAILLWSRYGPAPEAVYSDGISLRVPAARAAGRTILWEHPEPFEVPGPGGVDQFDPAFSPDGKSLVFARGQPGKNAGLWISRRTPETSGWSSPEPLDAIETPSDELGAAWDPGGTRLYFVSNRPGGEGGYDIWLSQKTDGGWAAPVNAGPSVNSPGDEIDPAVTAEGDVLYFASNRGAEPAAGARPGSAALRKKSNHADFDLYAALVDDGDEESEPDAAAVRFEPAVAADSLNSPGDDGQIAFTPRGDFAYFASDRAGGHGGFDLYRARWRDGGFARPVNLGGMINSPADEMDPSLALEGFVLAFSSDRGNGVDTRAGGAPVGIFFAVSREVDLETAHPWTGLSLARLARFYEEWRGMLLWLLLAMAGYWILALVQRHSSAEPSLTHRCFAVSLLVHAALLALFTVWNLTEALLDEPRDPSMEVAINTESLAAEKLATEIRESVASLPPVEIVAETKRFEAPPDFVPAEAPRLTVPDLPAANPAPRRPADPSFQIAETIEAAPAPSEALPKAVVTVADSTLEFAMEETLLDTGRPALVEENVELKTPSDDAGTPRAPREPRATPGKPILEEIPAVEADLKKVATPVLSVSQTPDLAGDFAPPAPATLPAPLVEIALDPMAASGADLIPQPLEVRAAQPRESAPGLALAPVSDTLARTRDIGLPDRPATDTRSVASLPLESPPGDPGVPAPANAATFERTELNSSTEPPGADTARPAPAALPQELILGDTPKLESPIVPENPYLLRDPRIRDRVIEELGGSKETEKAIRQSLDWFTRHQERDGHWNIQKFGGQAGHDVAATSLALLSYMGWGANHRDGGPYRDQVSRAVNWLVLQMKDDGDLRGWDGTRVLGNMYDQGMAVMALSEAYGLTKDQTLREPLEKSVAFIIAAQDPAAGSWRYHPYPQEKGGDTSVFGWQVMALRSAQVAGLDVPADVLLRCEKWLQTIGGGKQRGLYGYRDANPKPAMVAEGLFSRQLLGTPAADPKMRESVEYLGANLPSAKRVFFYYWYYGQLALYQNKGPVWDDWNAEMKAALLPTQHQKGAHAGSWDPTGQHGAQSGRAVVTAMATLTLEVYYRYLPLYNAME